jgi:hypothetical protein
VPRPENVAGLDFWNAIADVWNADVFLLSRLDLVCGEEDTGFYIDLKSLALANADDCIL